MTHGQPHRSPVLSVLLGFWLSGILGLAPVAEATNQAHSRDAAEGQRVADDDTRTVEYSPVTGQVLLEGAPVCAVAWNTISSNSTPEIGATGST